MRKGSSTYFQCKGCPKDDISFQIADIIPKHLEWLVERAMASLENTASMLSTSVAHGKGQ